MKIGIFGSVARGEQSDNSDVDVVYEGEANILQRARIKRELEALFGTSVDVVRLRKGIKDTLLGEFIKKEAIYV